MNISQPFISRTCLFLLAFSFCGLLQAQKPGEKGGAGKPANAKKGDPAEIAVAFYNVENLFDTLNDPAINDEEFLPAGKNQWTPERYKIKLTNLAKVISQLGDADGPEILGLAEVENRKVIEDLIREKSIVSHKYNIVHYNSPDERGIDVALIFKVELFQQVASRPVPVTFSDGKDDKTRDILLATLTTKHRDTIHVLVNHWPSRRGGEKESEAYRCDAAAVVRRLSDSLMHSSPRSKVIVMGDLNDNYDNRSIKEVLGASVNPDPAASVLYNPMAALLKSGQGSISYKGKWDLFDQIMVSPALLREKGYRYSDNSAAVYHPEWMCVNEGKSKGVPKRTFSGEKWFSDGYSDHFPVYLILKNVNR